MTSPYHNQPQEQWLEITKKLVEDYPLTEEEIIELVLESWRKLWTTKVGDIIPLEEVDLPAPVVGYFFQKIFTYELEQKYHGYWRGEQNKADKDLVYLKDETFSTEMKVSGQMGYKIFGNRSYCQSSSNPSKAKSGYYITVNFTNKTLNLISIGWIDKEDWQCQKAESGQAATLPREVYQYKLIPLCGAYQLESPIGLLEGVGKKIMEKLHENELYTFINILQYEGDDSQIINVKTKNQALLANLNQYLT